MQSPATLVSNPDLLQQISALQTTATQLVQMGTHALLGVGSAHSLEWLKNKPWFKAMWNNWSPRVRTVVGAMFALATSLGITATFVHASGSDGTYIITLSGLTAASVATHVSSFFQSWISQQAYFTNALKPAPVVNVAQFKTPVPVSSAGN